MRNRVKGEVSEQIWAMTKGHCWYCGEDTSKAKSLERGFTVDHVVPTSKGGPNSRSNLVPCCVRCNQRKQSRSVEEFRELAAMHEFLQMHGGVRFTDQMIVAFESIGCDMSPLRNLKNSHKFWFEIHGLNSRKEWPHRRIGAGRIIDG